MTDKLDRFLDWLWLNLDALALGLRSPSAWSA
jgi:hypothetical protein